MRCFTPEHDALYARGYPHMVELVDDHRDGRKPDLTKLFRKHFGAYHVRWPREVAHAFVAACTAVPVTAIATPQAAAHGVSTIDRDQARAALQRQLELPRRRAFHADRHLVWCVEAMLGTDTTLELLIDVLHALPRDRWPVPGGHHDPEQQPRHPQMEPIIHRTNVLGENSSTGYFAYLAGFLLLRATPATAAAGRARLEALWRATGDAGAIEGEDTLRGGLDLALHGSEGMRRQLPHSHWQYLHWWGFVDDPVLLRARLTARQLAEWSPDPRHAWLCPELVDLLFSTKVVRGLTEQRAQFLEDVGMFDHPAVAVLMHEWKADKKAGAVAQRWLDQHA
jgi:hypothetical protein